jgi:hypothetical protein
LLIPIGLITAKASLYVHILAYSKREFDSKKELDFKRELLSLNRLNKLKFKNRERFNAKRGKAKYYN